MEFKTKFLDFCKKNKKWLIIGGIAVALILAITITLIALLQPGEDKSKKNKNSKTNEEIAISENVKVFTENESQTVEDLLLAYEPTVKGLTVAVNEGSVLDSLSENDTFVLQGGEDSVFGSIYFGKITSIENNGGVRIYNIEAPCADEVLTNITFDTEAVLTPENITGFTAVEGVELITNQQISPQAFAENVEGPVLLSATDGNSGGASSLAIEIDPTIGPNSVGISIKVDILKLLEEGDVIEPDEGNDHEEVEPEESEQIIVYYTDTGLCYHRSSCHCLAKSQYPANLDYAIYILELRPCKICKPPVVNNSDSEAPEQGNDPEGEEKNPVSTDASLTLSGFVKLDNMSFSVVGKGGKTWNLKQGFDNLAVKVNGELSAETRLEGNFSMDISGEATRLIVWGDENDPKVYFEGLNEKLIPIAFITYNGGSVSVQTGTSANSLSAPLTVGIMLYTDLQGNISASTEVLCSYSRSFDYNFDVFKNGDFVAFENESVSGETQSGFDFSLKAEARADVDLQALAASVMLYVGNMNILELELVTAGVEAEGTLSIDSDEWSEGGSGISASAKLTMYIEMLDLNFRFKYKNGDALSVDPPALVRFDVFTYDSEETVPGGSEGAYELIYERRSHDIVNPDGSRMPDYYAVVGMNGSGVDIVVPSHYNGLEVNYIGANAFENCTSIKTVTLSQNIKWIEAEAFFGCTSLNDIYLPSTIVYIETGAFQNCSSLTEVYLPDIAVIESYTFFNCSELKTVKIPNNIDSIEYSAFLGCDSLETVYFDGTRSEWEEIEYDYSNSALYNATVICLRDNGQITWSYEEYDKMLVVEGTGDLPDYWLDDGNAPEWIDIIFNDYDEDVLNCIYIGEGITQIGNDCFGGYVEIVYIPKSVNRIRFAAFFGSIECIYYGGTEEEWNAIDIENDSLFDSVSIVYLGG